MRGDSHAKIQRTTKLQEHQMQNTKIKSVLHRNIKTKILNQIN